MENSISILVQPTSIKYKNISYRELTSQLMDFLNPDSDPNQDQQVLGWRTTYNNFRVTHVPMMTPALWHPAISLLAQWKAEDMLKRDYFSHYTPEGWGPWDLARMAGITPPGYVAECIAYGYREPWPLLQAYIASPTHLQVLEDDRFSHHGTGHIGTPFSLPTHRWSMMWIGGIE
jgi:uncharacterized protein YkwD